MTNQSTNPVAEFLREKGFRIKTIDSEVTEVSLSTRKLYTQEVVLALGSSFSTAYIEQSGNEVYVLYSDDASLLTQD